jgi:hypothetical protein
MNDRKRSVFLSFINRKLIEVICINRLNRLEILIGLKRVKIFNITSYT